MTSRKHLLWKPRRCHNFSDVRVYMHQLLKHFGYEFKFSKKELCCGPIYAFIISNLKRSWSVPIRNGKSEFFIKHILFNVIVFF